MTIGIYAIYWEEQDLIYIGQSVNIERRFQEHNSKAAIQKHSNYKVQELYNIYGSPTQFIIEECSSSTIDSREIFWTKEFNAQLTIVDPGKGVGRGTNHAASKYSKFQILKVFSFLYRTIKTYKEISRLTKVSEGVISSIAQEQSHL